MTLDFGSLRRGDVLPSVAFALSHADVRAYLEATGEPPGRWARIVPPLALGAFTLGGLMAELPLPPGALHAAQDFEFLAPVAIGERVEARLEVAQRSERQGSQVVVIACELRSGERVAMRGRTTVIAPLQPASGA